MSGYTSASSPQAAAAAAGWGRAGTILLQNKESRLPVYISPTERHVVLLLTPALPPDAVRGCDAAALQSDPFEALGRALASHCYSARHVPYMPRNGITALHVDHIRLATSIVFVITGPPCHGQPSQVGLAEVVRAICDDKPNIVVACCDIEELGPIGELFPTIIQVPDLSVPSLEAAASLVFQFADSSSVHQLYQPVESPAFFTHYSGQSLLDPRLDLYSDSQSPHLVGQGLSSIAPTVPSPASSSLHSPPNMQSPPSSDRGSTAGVSQRAPGTPVLQRVSPTNSGLTVRNLVEQPYSWRVEFWDRTNDYDGVHELWNQSLPRQFRLSARELQNLLGKEDYARTWVVKEPGTRQVLGFCSTLTTYASGTSDQLVGSLAMLIVRSSYQKRGIGLSLHNFAVAELRRTKNVGHLQLGSTFPRLLYGVPTGSPAEEWFRRRGWPMRQTGPGTGQEVCDWLLGIDEWPSPGPLPLARWTFRRCNLDESARVYSVAERHLQTPAHTGWLHQYAQLAGTMNMSDVVLGTDEQGDIVAMAITYCRLTAGPLTDDLPWPTVLGDDVGGVTCMCVTGTVAPSTRDALMLGLLEHCVQVLKEQGMSRIFIDATKNGDGSFQSMGMRIPVPPQLLRRAFHH